MEEGGQRRSEGVRGGQRRSEGTVLCRELHFLHRPGPPPRIFTDALTPVTVSGYTDFRG